MQHFSAAPALESCFVGGAPPATCGPTAMRPAWAGSQHWAGTGPASVMAVTETGPATLLASLGVSDGPPLQASPNLQSPADRSPGWPAAPPASVPEDRDLSALGITPAPLGRSARRWQLRRSGAAVQETPAPLARGASGLGAIGWLAAPAVQGAAAAAGGSCDGRSSTVRTAGAAHLAGFETTAVGPGFMSVSEPSAPGLGLPRSGREAALQPLGGGMRRFGLTHGSPGKVLPPQHGPSLHNAATVAALPLAVGSLAPGRSSCVSPAPRAQACGPAGGIPEPLKVWNVRSILSSLRHKAGENVPPLPRDCAPAQRSEESRWGAAGECGAGLVSRRSCHTRLGPGSSLAAGGWAGPGASPEPTQCSPVGGVLARLRRWRLWPVCHFHNGNALLCVKVHLHTRVPSTASPTPTHWAALCCLPRLQYRPRAWHVQHKEDFSPLMRGLLAEPGSMQPPGSGVHCWGSEGGGSADGLWGWPQGGGSSRRRSSVLWRAAGWLLERLHLG